MEIIGENRGDFFVLATVLVRTGYSDDFFSIDSEISQCEFVRRCLDFEPWAGPTADV